MVRLKAENKYSNTVPYLHDDSNTSPPSRPSLKSVWPTLASFFSPGLLTLRCDCLGLCKTVEDPSGTDKWQVEAAFLSSKDNIIFFLRKDVFS